MFETDGWHLVGRNREVHRIVTALRNAPRGRGVAVVGPAGVGRTRLAHEAAGRADHLTTRWVTATYAARSVPLGAFADWLPSDVDDPTRAVGRIVDRLMGEDSSTVLLVVDDAHLLDAASVFLVQRVIDRCPARVLLTLRGSTGTGGAAACLWRSGAVQRIDVGPLGRPDCRTLVLSALGGRVDPAVETWLCSMAGGNLGYLRALVTSQLHSGGLRRDDGMWTWATEPVVPDIVCDLVLDELGEPTAPLGELLDLLAVADNLPVRALVNAVGPIAVEAAERRGLIVTTDDPNPSARIAHPLHGEVLRSRLRRIRLRRLRGTAARVLRDGAEPTAAAVVGIGLLLLDADDEPTVTELLDASKAALWQCDCDTSLRLATSAQRSGDWRADVAVADALTLAGRSAEAEAQFLAIDRDGTSEDEVVLVRAHALNLLTQNRTREALEVIGAAEPASELAALGAFVAACAGDDDEALVRVAEALGTPATVRPDSVLAVVAHVMVHGERDGLPPVDRVARLGLETARTSWQTSFGRLLLTEAVAAASTLAGEYRAAEQAIDALDGEPVSSICEGWISMMRGAALVAKGCVGQGADRLTAATTSARLGLLGGWLRRYQLDLAIGLAARGDTEAAERVARRVEAASHPLCSHLEPVELVARAWVSASSGAVSAAIRDARQAASLARRRRRWAREVWCLHAAVRFGDRTAVERLQQLRGLVENPRIDIALDHAEALAAGDGDALLAASRRYEDMGDLLAAVDSAVQAAAVLRDVGRRGSAFGAVRRSRALAEACGAVRAPSLVTAYTPREFTRREREVALLAARGLRNRDIADRLHISVRTVEGHLYRATNRVGARSRAELAEAVCADLGEVG